MAVATIVASNEERLELDEEVLATISRRARKPAMARGAKTGSKAQRIEAGRGPSSSEVLFAWRVAIDSIARAQHGEAVALPMSVMAVDGVSVRMVGVRPAELVESARQKETFACDTSVDGAWVFACVLHEDDWANADHRSLAQKLAALDEVTGGVLVAAQDGVIIDGWIFEQGKARQIEPLPEIAFKPAIQVTALAVALSAVRDRLAAIKAPKAPRFAEELPPLIAPHLPAFDLLPTNEALCFRFNAHPGYALRFEIKGRKCTPVLARESPADRGSAPSERLQPKPGTFCFDPFDPIGLKQGLASLVDAFFSTGWKGLGAELPFFLIDQGEEVSPSSVLAVLANDQRHRVERVAAAPGARPELLTACADYLIAGAWDERARMTLIAILHHPSCPLALAWSLAGHRSNSVKEAAVVRVKRG